jgi:hypothetical protein
MKCGCSGSKKCAKHSVVESMTNYKMKGKVK